MLYEKNEMISQEYLSKHTKNIIENLGNGNIEKVAIINNNEPQAVMISFKEYEHIKNIAQMIENKEIESILEERMPNGILKNPISHEELLERLKKRGRDV